MVSPPADVIARIQKDIKNVKAARAILSDFDDVLKNGFIWLYKIRIYGSQRILNGQLRQPHYGIDISSLPEGVAVRVRRRQVTMAEDLYFTGGTIIIDHGYGLNSTYSHLLDMKAKMGDRVERGQVIGSVGSTGRAHSTASGLANQLAEQFDPQLIISLAACFGLQDGQNAKICLRRFGHKAGRQIISFPIKDRL